MKNNRVGLTVVLVVFLLSCNSQQEFLSNNLQEEMASRRVVNDTSGQQVFYLTDKVVPLHKNTEYTWYRNGKVHTTMGNYSGTLLNGDYEQFDTDYNLKSKGEFSRGVRVGRWENWYATGHIASIQYYDARGRLNGKYENYNAQKELLEEGFYKHGEKNGTWVRGVDTIRYKNGNIFVRDTTKPTFIKRLFKKKENQEGKASKKTNKNKEPNFFQKIFSKKIKNKRKAND